MKPLKGVNIDLSILRPTNERYDRLTIKFKPRSREMYPGFYSTKSKPHPSVNPISLS